MERLSKIIAYELQLEMDTDIIRSMCRILGEPLPDKNWWMDEHHGNEYIETMALCPRDEGILPIWEEQAV
jgi:hypothetical protein